MRGLPIKYCRYIIEKIEVIANEPSTFVFRRLRQAMLLWMTAIKGAK